jgi:hypothetical protein
LTAALTEKAPPTDSRLGVCVLRGGGLRLQLIDEVDVLVATGDYQSIYLFLMRRGNAIAFRAGRLWRRYLMLICSAQRAYFELLTKCFQTEPE